ncbi:unannotated protein [freshwater metagenome]|uniref:Unannotated protein n=1 Tax=freshwater metagenome TaxID=449393 RepID=A0A6J5Z3H0_9ZZZZ
MISTLTPYLLASFFIRKQKESGVRCDGGVLIKSLTNAVCSAIISARFAASFACAVSANLLTIETVASGGFCSDFLLPKNSVNV